MSVRLYIGNLPKELERQELEALFAEDIGEAGSTKVVTDRKTGKCRGFGFVTVETSELADQIIEKFNGLVFKDSTLKIEIATPKENEEPKVSDAPVGKRSPKNNKVRRTATPMERSSSEEIQPDPRWAQELEKLKQMLAAQASNS
jgi:RNA recognition motif-containing protein